MNLKCASCYDSFINKYKLKQSYGMAALFADDPNLELVRCDVKLESLRVLSFCFLKSVRRRTLLSQTVAQLQPNFSPPRRTAGWLVRWRIGSGEGSSTTGWSSLYIEGLGFTRMHGHVALDDSSVRDDIMPAVRFFVFSAEPDRHQFVAVTGTPPASAPPPESNPDSLINNLYMQALCRKPRPEESKIAHQLLAPGGKATVSGLEDLLWALLMHPELQYIY